MNHLIDLLVDGFVLAKRPGNQNNNIHQYSEKLLNMSVKFIPNIIMTKNPIKPDAILINGDQK